MSVRVMTKVFRESKSTGVARLVLLALADVAGDSGEVTAYARSHSTLARKANCNEGSVRRAIRDLEALGEVVVLVVGDGRTKSDYRILLPSLPPETDDGFDDRHARAGRASGADRPRNLRDEGAQDVPPITPSLSIPNTSSDAADAAVDLFGNEETRDQTPTARARSGPAREAFEEFWLAYPKRQGAKVGKSAAGKLWGKLSAADRVAAAAGLAGYAAAKKGFPEDAERYLRHRRWEGVEVDAPEPERVVLSQPSPRAGPLLMAEDTPADFVSAAEHLRGLRGRS